MLSPKGSGRHRQSMLERYGSPEAVHAHYREIGAKGGRGSTTGGFHARPELASAAGKIGGAKGKRGKSKRRINTLST